MNKLIYVFMFIMLIGLASATFDAGTYKQGTSINLLLDCSNNATYCSTAATCNVTVNYQNGSFMINNLEMSKTYYPSFNKTLPDTSISGIYTGSQMCCDGGNCGFADFTFEINPSGNTTLSSGSSLMAFGALLTMIIIGIFFLFIAGKFDNTAGKIIFIGCAAVTFLIAILFTVLVLTQTLGAYNDIVEGYATFLFVIKVVAGIALTALVIFVLFLTYIFWQKKRGLWD